MSDSPMVEVKVIAHAVILRIGPKRADAQRFMRGTILRLEEGDSRLEHLLATRSAAKVREGREPKNATVRSVVTAVGAAEDPVASVQPVESAATPAKPVV